MAINAELDAVEELVESASVEKLNMLSGLTIVVREDVGVVGGGVRLEEDMVAPKTLSLVPPSAKYRPMVPWALGLSATAMERQRVGVRGLRTSTVSLTLAT